MVKCRPPDNRDPRPEEIAACRPYLEEQVRLIEPKVVVTLGNFSTKLLLQTDQGITKVRGSSYPMGAYALVPTYHPAAALRSGGVVVAEMRADLIRAKQLMGWAHVSARGTGVRAARSPPIGGPEDTVAIAGAVAGLAAPGTCCCWPATSAPARRRSPRGSAPGWGSRSR